MPSLISPGISLNQRTFSIVIAPSRILSKALNNYIFRQKGSILVLSGNFPMIIPRINANRSQLHVKTINHAHQILTTLEESTQPLILIEHDRSFYDYDADLIRPIARMCRQKVSEKGTVFMFATRSDGWISNFQPFAHKMIYYEERITDSTGTNKPTGVPSGQRILQV